MPALANVSLSDTFSTWLIRTNQLVIKTNDSELALISAFDKANAANLLAYSTNNFILSTIIGANTAVGAGANAFASATIAGANSAVGTGANTFLLKVIEGANNIVGSGANAFASEIGRAHV